MINNIGDVRNDKTNDGVCAFWLIDDNISSKVGLAPILMSSCATASFAAHVVRQ